MTETCAWVVEYAVPVLVLVNGNALNRARFADGGPGDITQVDASELPAGSLRKTVLDIAESAVWPQ